MAGEEVDGARDSFGESGQRVRLAGGRPAGRSVCTGVLAAGVAEASRLPGPAGEPAAGELAGRPKLLLGHRSGGVVHGCAVLGQVRAGDVASGAVRARGVVLWRAAGDDVPGEEVSGDVPGRSSHSVASARTRSSGEPLGQGKRLEEV